MNKSDAADALGKSLGRSRTPEELAIPIINRMAEILYWKQTMLGSGTMMNPIEKPPTRRARNMWIWKALFYYDQEINHQKTDKEVMEELGHEIPKDIVQRVNSKYSKRITQEDLH